MSSYQVVADNDEALDIMDSLAFNIHTQVLLEEEPRPVPAQTPGQYAVQVLDESTDHVTLRVNTTQAGILLITDAYSEGWKAIALPGSVQQKYDVLPADMALRAIPLKAGEHLFRMEYLPDAFVYGRIATFAGLAVFIMLATVSFMRRRNTVE